jgi:hypothetical protein
LLQEAITAVQIEGITKLQKLKAHRNESVCIALAFPLKMCQMSQISGIPNGCSSTQRTLCGYAAIRRIGLKVFNLISTFMHGWLRRWFNE